ncbi:hypothetical protein ACFL43_01605 [Thermodesulfobacteriota bacterium]
MIYFLGFVSALALSALVTPLVRSVAMRRGAVVAPRQDRWHTTATPVLGGIAIYVSFTAVLLATAGLEPHTLLLLACGTLVFAIGLLDDLRGLTPQVKFIGQIAVAALLIAMGTVVEIIPWPVVAYPVTFVWIVGLTNAFNLIDNMDGLSAGIAAISSLALFVFSLPYGNDLVALQSLVLAGAAIGFLFYNFNPARIFMGDCGSMFLGFTLAALSISGTWKHASSLFVTLLLPVLLLSIPIFDTAFVTFTRKLRGQPISQGGKDHISHRLVALGFSERKTVLILYAVSAVFALGTLFFNKINPVAFVLVALVFCLGLLYFGIFLGSSGTRVTGGAPIPVSRNRQVKAFLVNAQRFVEIFVDLVLIAAAYFAAYLIRFEGGLPDLQLDYFMQTLPIVIVVKVLAFYYFGLYQTMWRHVGVRDFVNIVKGVFISALIIVVIILMYARFQYFSRTVFVVDAMLTLLLVSGAHFSLRILREYLEGQPLGGKRVLLIGAGDAGEMALREIRNNPGMKYHVAGFLDDDSFKQKRKIHSVPVLGKIEDIGRVAQQTGVREAFVAIPSLSADGVSRIMALCRSSNVSCKVFSALLEREL